MARRCKIPKSVARAIDSRSARRQIIEDKVVLKEAGTNYIECRMVKFNDNSIICEVSVIEKVNYSDDPTMNTLYSIEGKSMHDKNEANRYYLEMLRKYSA